MRCTPLVGRRGKVMADLPMRLVDVFSSPLGMMVLILAFLGIAGTIAWAFWDKQRAAVKMSSHLRRKRRRSSLSASPVATRPAVSGASADAMQEASSCVLRASKARSKAMGMPEVSAALDVAGFFDGVSDPSESATGSGPEASHRRSGTSADDPAEMAFSPQG